MHWDRSSLISVSAVRVTEFIAWSRNLLISADCFKVLGVTLKARVLSLRTRPSFLCIWFTFKAVTSEKKKPYCFNYMTTSRISELITWSVSELFMSRLH